MAMALVSAFKGISLSPSRDSRVLPAGVVNLPFSVEAAHKKGSGSTKNGRDSQAKRLGVKIFGSEAAKPGSIIVRQRGNKFHAGNNVGVGKDYTLYSLIDGVVKFENLRPKRQKVSVYPAEEKPPEDPNSRRAKKREHFRALREKRAAKEDRRLTRLLELYRTPAKFPEPVFTVASSEQETAPC